MTIYNPRIYHKRIDKMLILKLQVKIFSKSEYEFIFTPYRNQVSTVLLQPGWKPYSAFIAYQNIWNMILQIVNNARIVSLKTTIIFPWCNDYRRRKWTRRYEFKSWTRLIAFHIALIPLGKVWIQLFSLQTRFFSLGEATSLGEGKTLNSNLLNFA